MQNNSLADDFTCGDLELLVRGLADTLTHRSERRKLVAMADRLGRGEPLAEVLSLHEGVTRGIGEVLPFLASDPESAFKFLEAKRKAFVARQRLWISLYYPLMLCGLAMIAFTIVSIQGARLDSTLRGVQGDFQNTWGSLTRSVPLARHGSALSEMVLAIGFTCLVTLAAIRLVGGRSSATRFFSGLPLIGSWLRGQASADFIRLLGMLLERGQLLNRALQLAAGASENPIIRIVGLKLATQIDQGETLAKAFLAHTWFPRWVGIWLMQGRFQGSLGKQLQGVASLIEGHSLISARLLGRMVPVILLVAAAVLLQISFYEVIASQIALIQGIV